MTFNHKNNHTNEIRVLKLGKNEVLHNIIGLICQKLKIQDGRWQPFWIYANKHIKKKYETSPLHQILFYICWTTCVQNFITLSGFSLSNVLRGILQLTRSRGREARTGSSPAQVGT